MFTTVNKAHSKVKSYIKSVITDPVSPRAKQWDLIRALGIIFVVWGHNYQPPYVFYPAFFFHMSLFFFISGYFFIPQITIKDKLKYFLKKTRRQLIPYLVLNLLFGLITLYLKPMGIYLGGDINFYNMFLAPFGRGDQFTLYLAAWFLFNLYFISIFAGLIFQKSIKVNIVITVIAFIVMLAFLNTHDEPNYSIWPFISRSIFGFVFLSFGYLFRLAEPQLQKILIKPITIIILYIIVNILTAYYGNIWYSILFGNVSNDYAIVPVITSLCIILMVYIITFYLNKVFNSNSFIYEIGRRSFSIMVWHLFFFFIVNVILFTYNQSSIQLSALSDVYYKYEIEKLWLLYQVPAIILPVFMGMYYDLSKRKFKSLLIKLHFNDQPVPNIKPVPALTQISSSNP